MRTIIQETWDDLERFPDLLTWLRFKCRHGKAYRLRPEDMNKPFLINAKGDAIPIGDRYHCHIVWPAESGACFRDYARERQRE